MYRRVCAAVLLIVCAWQAARADELKVHANRLYLPVTINGVKAEALLDSAAEGTFVDPKLATKAGIKPEHSQTAKGAGGSTEVLMAKNVSIDAAGVKLTNMTVALLDMTELSKLVQTDLQIILGREFFDAREWKSTLPEGRSRGSTGQ